MDLNPSQAAATTQHDVKSSTISQEENPKFALDLNYPIVDAKSGYKIVDGIINIDSDDDEDDIGDDEDAGADDLVDNADNSVADVVDHSHGDKDNADNSVADDVDHRSHNDKDDAHGHVDEQNNESHNN